MKYSLPVPLKNHSLSNICFDETPIKCNLSTGLGDRINMSYNVPALKNKSSRILSSGTKLRNGACLEISMTLPKVEHFRLILKG